MDIVSLVRYVSAHNDKVSGTLVALLLLTSILLLIRSINERKDASNAVNGARINLDEIESVIRRVLGPQSGQVVTAIAGEAAVDGVMSTVAPGDPADIQVAVAEREARIQDLSVQLEKMKTELGAKSGGASAEALAELQTRIDELQARLAEYEIIEDDIADLSRFKDENAKLRAEIERLKAGGAVTPVAQASSASAEAPIPAPAPVADGPEKFALDTSDEVMRQFAQAVQVDAAVPAPDVTSSLPNADHATAIEASAPPEETQQQAVPETMPEVVTKAIASDAAGIESAPSEGIADTNAIASELDQSVDTEKMLSEVELFGAAVVTDESSALDESLDTDRLLAEADVLVNEKEEVPASPPVEAAKIAAPAAEPAVEPPAMVAASAALAEVHPEDPEIDALDLQSAIADEDDLLAEFRQPVEKV